MNDTTVVEVIRRYEVKDSDNFILIFVTADEVKHLVLVIPADLDIFFRGDEFLGKDLPDAFDRARVLNEELNPPI